MWRSKASAFLLRSSPLGRLPGQIQVPLKTLSRPSPPRPNPSTCSSTADAHLRQRFRFFSVDPAAGGVRTTGEVSSDEDDRLGYSAVTSTGSDASLASDPHSNSAELGFWSTGFREGGEKGDDFGENRGLGSVAEESKPWEAAFREVTEKDDVFVEKSDAVLPADGEPWSSFDSGEKVRIAGEDSDSLRKENVGGGDELWASFAPEESAEEAGEEISEIDNENLENLLSFLQSTVEEPLEAALDKMDITLSKEFVAKVLQTPLILGDKLIGFFRWSSKQPEFVMTSSTVDLLVEAVSSSDECSISEAYMLWDLIKEIGETEKELLEADILNQLISLFCKLEKAKAGFEVFNRFEEFGCRPNANSYYLTVQVLSKRSMLDAAWSICERMLASGDWPDGEKIGKIITILCKGKRVKDAHFVYLTAKENDKCLPQCCVDYLVSGLSRNDNTVHTSLELLDDYSEESRKYAIKPFTSVITGLCRIKDVEEAKKLLYKMINSGPSPGNAVFNHVISSLSKAGEMDDAIALMKQMENRGLRPDMYTYSVIMSGFAKGGLMDEAHKIFNEAKKRYPKLISTMYHILIRGYCKIEEFETAVECMRKMKNDGIQPNTDEYGKMVQSLCLKALDWHSAEKLLEEMKESGLHLKGITCSLIAAVKELEEEELKNVMAIEA